jgi:hypothetical protein
VLFRNRILYLEEQLCDLINHLRRGQAAFRARLPLRLSSESRRQLERFTTPLRQFWRSGPAILLSASPRPVDDLIDEDYELREYLAALGPGALADLRRVLEGPQDEDEHENQRRYQDDYGRPYGACARSRPAALG